jgi:hypothetical protein
VVLISAFTIGGAAALRCVYLSFHILQLVQKTDPTEAAKLTGGSIPALGRLMWIDPIRFFVFAHWGSSEDEHVITRIRQFRKSELVMLLSWMVFISLRVVQPL